MSDTEPALSVVVTVVDGGETLERCLTALANQPDAAMLDVIVPYDTSVEPVAQLAARFPHFQFVALGRLETERPVQSFAGQHELFDRRRAAGLARARAPLVAIVEDRGVPRPDWSRAMQAAHRDRANAVIGGAIENGRHRVLNWAVYYCDFGRYQLPLAGGARAYVSDVNICYRRDVLERFRELWAHRYHEPTVHWAMQREGETLILRSEPVVDQYRTGLRLGAMVRERVSWGRLFGCIRAREISGPKRLLLAALTPATVVLLYYRLVAGRIARGGIPRSFVTATPAILALLSGWCLGESLGYLTKKA